MSSETLKTISAINLGELVKVNSTKEIVSLASNFQRMFPDVKMVEEAVSYVEKSIPITYIAFSFIYGMPVIAFFQYDFYGKFRVARGKQRIVYAYVFNMCIPEYSDYGSVYVKNINGKYYYIP